MMVVLGQVVKIRVDADRDALSLTRLSGQRVSDHAYHVYKVKSKEDVLLASSQI